VGTLPEATRPLELLPGVGQGPQEQASWLQAVQREASASATAYLP
jgi:hypothetical protein